MRIQVLIRLRPSVLDVQGKAIEGSLKSLPEGEGLSHIRVGKCIEFDVPASSLKDAEPQIKVLCEKLFANTIIEDYEIKAA